MKWIWNEQIVALSNAEEHFLGFLKEEVNLARAEVHSFLKQCLDQGNFFHNLQLTQFGIFTKPEKFWWKYYQNESAENHANTVLKPNRL